MQPFKQLTTLILITLIVLPAGAQKSSFDQFRQQQKAEFGKFQSEQQAKYDAFRKMANEKYAEFMRRPWAEAAEMEADTIVQEQNIRPYIFEEQSTNDVIDTGTAEDISDNDSTAVALNDSTDLALNDSIDEDTIEIKWTRVLPIPVPQASMTTTPVQIPVRQIALVMPGASPAPEPIAPVASKAVPKKQVSIAYYGTIISIPFPEKDNLKIRQLTEDGIADAWLLLSDSIYDNTIKAALDIRKTDELCDWAYLDVLRQVTEKQYGQTNEAVLAQAFIMTQSGYRIRLGRSDVKLYLLMASQYDIFSLRYYMIDGSKFYVVSGERNAKMYLCEAKYGKEQPLSMQMTVLPQLGDEQTEKRTLVSKKGVTSATSVNKNLIDFFNNYPQACYKGEQSTRWVAYANTPIEKSIKKMLYPPLQSAIKGLGEKEAVGVLLNWVQTAFAYEYDDKVWGGDRAFFAQETLFYPFCDCEDRSILFSRLVRDLTGLDILFLYYPGHLATAVGFKGDVQGDWVEYNGKKYVVCDPTFINAGVGRTMPGMNNQQAQIIALK